jgi:hypothetical protein
VFAFGDAPFLGSLPGLGIPIDDVSAIASTVDGQGYLLVDRHGGVAAFGDARFYSSLPAFHVTPAEPIMGLVPTKDRNGYWLIGSDGGVFTFGDASYLGSLPGLNVNVSNIVGAVETSYRTS